MNKKQIICMWIGIALFILGSIGCSPYVNRGSARYPTTTIAFSYFGPYITTWINVTIVTAGLIYTFRDKNPKDK